MPTGSGTDATTIAAWLTSLAAIFGIGVGIAKARTATIDRIETAKAEGTEAKTACERLHQKLLESELEATTKYASIPHLSSVEKRVKEEVKASEERSKEALEAMETRLVNAIKQRRENYHRGE